MPANNESARGRVAAARDRAAAARDRVQVAAIKGAGWKILEFFAQNTTAWGALFYVLLSSIGVTYSWAFYSRFESIHIFDFFDTSDFLLSAFQNVDMLMIGIIATLISIGIPLYRVRNSIVYAARNFNADIQQSQIRWEAVILLLVALGSIIFISCSWLKWPLASGWALASIKTEWERPGSIAYLMSVVILFCLACRFIRIVQIPAIWVGRVRWAEVILLFIIPMGATFILPFLYGKAESHEALEDKSRLVRVTISQDAAQSQTRLPTPEHTLFLGTTSSFHFFYECKNALDECEKALDECEKALDECEKALVDENGQTPKQDCGKGHPFIVPTANIASLAFNRQKGESEVGPSAIATAITELKRTIAGLKFGVPFKTESGDIIFDTTWTAEAIFALSESIENLQLQITSDPGLGKVAEAIITLSESIKNRQPPDIPNLSSDEIAEAIITLSKTIGSLKLYVPANSGPDMTAVLEALTATLSTLDTTIASLNFNEVQNRCASSLEKVATVGPFPTGVHDRLEEDSPKDTRAEGECQGQLVPPDQLATLDEFFCRMRDHFTSHQTPQHLVLIGRVDRSQLSRENIQFYGTQIELAKARAEWVQGELLKKFSAQIDPKRITLLSGKYREENEDDNRRERDRVVEVWACGAPEQPDQAGTTTNSGE